MGAGGKRLGAGRKKVLTYETTVIKIPLPIKDLLKSIVEYEINYLNQNGNFDFSNRYCGDDRPRNLIAAKKGTSEKAPKPQPIIGSEKTVQIGSQSKLVIAKKAEKVQPVIKPKQPVIELKQPIIELKQPIIEVESPIIEKPVFKGVRCSDCKVNCKNQGYLAKIVLQSGCPDFKRKGV